MKPLVSIVIPCFNQGRFLAQCIQSIKDQTYDGVEIIVINDGSTDNTAEIIASFPDIQAIYQENQGLAAARNLGFRNSRGSFIVFLDSDDWLYPDAIEKNLSIMQRNPDLAFVSGGHTLVDETGRILGHSEYDYIDDPYVALLETNYVRNPATVMYRREIMEAYPFDGSGRIPGCEDYDHYLRITRDRRVFHHNAKICFYRRHGNNMSDNYSMMLSGVLQVLESQKSRIRTHEEQMAWDIGMEKWNDIYAEPICDQLLNRRFRQLTPFEKKILKKNSSKLLGAFWKKLRFAGSNFLP